MVRNSLDPEQDPDPDWNFWLDPGPDSMHMDPKHYNIYNVDEKCGITLLNLENSYTDLLWSEAEIGENRVFKFGLVQRVQ